MGKVEAKKSYQHFVTPARRVPDWYKNYNFILVTSMSQLEEIFENANWTPGQSLISFDTETTGLDFEELDIVGYSFCLDGKNCYYVPVNHFEYVHNLGEPACQFIYERLCEAKLVFMYNARFDMRAFEYIGYKEKKEELDKKRWKFVKYDFSKVNYFDIMNACWLADTNLKLPTLKGSSLHFMGYEQMHFEEVIEEAGNFYYLNPSENPDAVYYAGADALCTFLLAPLVLPYYKESGIAGQVDNRVMYPLMHCESEKIYLDKELLDRYVKECEEEVEKLEKEVYEAFGYTINLNSPAQVSQALERLGIDTGEKTASGNMATGIEVLEGLPDEMKEKFPALKAFLRYKETFKLLNSYLSVYKKEADKKGYLRAAYKLQGVPTGRLATGKDGKNPYFSPTNLQSVPKPHVCMYDVFDLGDRNLFSKKENIIMGFKFVVSQYDDNKKHIIPDDPTYIGWAEGMDPKLNARATLTPKMYEDSGDDEFVYCLDPLSSFVEEKTHGYVPLFMIEEYMKMGEVPLVKTPNGYKKVLNYFHTGKKKSYKLVLKDGNEIICSAKHKFKVGDEWKKLEDMITTDSVIVDENRFEDVVKDPIRYIPGYDCKYKVNLVTGQIYYKRGEDWIEKVRTVNNRGYYQVQLRRPNSKRTDHNVIPWSGKLIIRAYYGCKEPFPGYNIVDHLDSVKTHDSIFNLKICTPKQNNSKFDLWRDHYEGERNNKNILSEDDVNYIKRELNTNIPKGMLQQRKRELADKFGVSLSNIQQIYKGHSWVRNRNVTYFSDDSNILAIQELEDDYDMVDIEVEDVHCYYVNSVLTHNCACDYAAQELRIVANMSGEPVWANAFLTGNDVHKSTACVLWGEENYNKDLRKRAKGVNFGIVYGMGAPSMIDPKYGINTLAEAEDFFNHYKKSLPTLFQWIDRKQRAGRRNGTVYTFFGRPRRVKGYFDNGNYSFANRTIINTQIQGSAADMLKLVICKLWKNVLDNPEYRDDISWKITIHDEIGYSVRATRCNELMGLIEDTQTMKFDQWPIPLLTEASVGWSVGCIFAFERKEDSSSSTGFQYWPKLD